MQKNKVLLYTAVPSANETMLINELNKIKSENENKNAYILAFCNDILFAKSNFDKNMLDDILIKDYLFNRLSKNEKIIPINTLDNIFKNRNNLDSILNTKLNFASAKADEELEHLLTINYLIHPNLLTSFNEEMRYLLAINYVKTLDNKFERGNEVANDVYDFLSQIDTIKSKQEKDDKKLVKAPVVTVVSNR